MSIVRGSKLTRYFSSWIIAALAGLSLPALGDDNLLGNPEFDIDADAWFGGGWSQDDSGSCPGSGSLALSSVHCAPVIGCNDFGFWQAIAITCTQVTPGMTIYQSVDVRSNQPSFLSLRFFSDAGCATEAGENSDPGIFVPAGDWQTAWRASVIPAGVLSVLPVFVSGGFASTNVAGNLDRAWLGFEDRIFADDFEGETTCRWTTTIGG